MHVPQGAVVAMLTPFDDSGRISEPEIMSRYSKTGGGK